MHRFQVIIHGGANYLTDETEIRKSACQKIICEIETCFQDDHQASSLDVCEKAIMLLEDNVLFNAGTGSYLQTDGKPRMDACIMESTLRVGSVIQLENIKNPISVARKLLEEPMHCTLSGVGAQNYALTNGFSSYNPGTEKQFRVHQQTLLKLDNNISYSNTRKNYETVSQDKLGTVGCVVRDKQNGTIVAGTSTGGLRVCYPGRVGDTAQIGNGNYANQFVGVSCTGIGEKILRLTLARLVSFLIESGHNLEKACQESIKMLGDIGGEGGVIAISHDGHIAFHHNTPTMSYAISE